MPLMPLFHITAAYSNAVLTVVLSHVSDCAKKLDLPIKQPITAEQVARFNINPYTNNVGGGLWLTNGYWFVYSFGCVDSFRSPDNWFAIQEFDGVQRFVGNDNMTTNDAVEFTRNYFIKLGYQIETFHLNEKPARIEGPFEAKQLGHIPFCRIVWESPEPTTLEERQNSYTIHFDVDLQKKQIVGMELSATNFFRPNPEIGVKPELESDYRKRTQGTNSPPH
jgi:hypothetical protein